MIDEQQLTIHVVYVPNTVDLLLPFLSTLMQHSGCRYRVVSNACGPKEETALRDLAAAHDRVSFHSLEADAMLLHHEVLHRLLLLDDDPYFAFFDSDMVADRPFLNKLLTALANHDAVFTGLPMWHETHERVMPENFMIAGGRFYQAHNGHLLGLSYAAIYRREPLLRFMDQTGLDFRRYDWASLPTNYQKRLAELGLRKQVYDTAKVLNILMQDQGSTCCFQDNAALIHFGGVSDNDYQSKAKKRWKTRLVNVVPPLVRNWYQILIWRKGGVETVEAVDMAKLIRKRSASARVLGQFIQGERVDLDHPTLRFLSAEVKASMQQKMDRVSKLFP